LKLEDFIANQMKGDQEKNNSSPGDEYLSIRTARASETEQSKISSPKSNFIYNENSMRVSSPKNPFICTDSPRITSPNSAGIYSPKTLSKASVSLKKNVSISTKKPSARKSTFN